MDSKFLPPRRGRGARSCPRADRRWKQHFASRAAVALFLLVLGSGCAGHSAKTVQARAALDANQPAQARKLLNQELQVKGPDEIPEKIKKNTALLVLDRSQVSTQLEEYQQSSNDLQFADKQIEMLDMSRTAVDDIGKYVFSDNSGPYKGPPYEKLMINTMNIVNYLARHDLNGARVEARRLSIMQKYLKDNGHPAESMNAPGGYLAGFVFEKSERSDIALRYYDEALSYTKFRSLVEPIARLKQTSAYSTPRLEEFLKEFGPSASQGTETSAVPAGETSNDGVTTTESAENATSGELLVIVNYGRIPAKVAKRIPIGLALTYATLFMSPSNTATANRLAAQGLVSWINYPELEEDKRKVTVPSASVNGKALALESAVAIDLEARKAYEETRGRVIASAITRLVTRIVAGEAAGAGAKAASGEGWVGALVSLGTQAALTAADTPDTRSWSTLPARIAVGRTRLPAGKHRVVLRAQGNEKSVEVDLAPGGWEAVVLTVLR